MGFHILARVAGVGGTTERLWPKSLRRAYSGMSFVGRSLSPRKRGGARPRLITGTKNELIAGRSQLFLDVFATNGVGMCWTFSLPHFGQFGWAASCSARCSACSNISPHFSQRYW